MRYNWKPYGSNDANLVDSWLDEDAVRNTGLEDGWQHFYAYWTAESRTGEGKDCCFLISLGNTPFAVMYVAIEDGGMVISEYVVAPAMRGKGHGTAALKELLDNSAQLLNTGVSLAKAVVFSNNKASAKCFEKAGFVPVLRHGDDAGAALYYEYRLDAVPIISM